MYRTSYLNRMKSIAVIATLFVGGLVALAMIPADPATLARVTASTGAGETIASIDALLGPPPGAATPPVDPVAPIDRAALAPRDPGLQAAALTTPIEEPAPALLPNDAIGAAAVNLRAGPSSGAATLAVLQPGQPIQISGEQEGWIEVTLPDGSTGWVYSRYLASAPAREQPAEPSPPSEIASAETDLTGRTARIEANLAVRSKPSGSARIVFRTEPGERVRIIGTNGEWLQIRTVDGNLGWIEHTG
jgi:SH3-like domain-containing protein